MVAEDEAVEEEDGHADEAFGPVRCEDFCVEELCNVSDEVVVECADIKYFCQWYKFAEFEVIDVVVHSEMFDCYTCDDEERECDDLHKSLASMLP